MNALVSGVTGNVGRSAAWGLLKELELNKLFLVGRSQEKLQLLRREYFDAENDDRIVLIEADLSSAAGAKSALERLHDFGVQQLDIVVSSSGPWWRVPALHEMDPNTWNDAVAANLSAHFFTFNALAKISKTFVFVNGAAALSAGKSGLTGALANAVHGLAETAQAQKSGVYELLIQVRVADGEGPHAIPTKTFGRTFAAVAKGELSNKGFTKIDDAAWTKLNQKN